MSGTTGDDTIDVTVNGLGAITVIEGMTPTTVESYTVDGLANGAAGDTLSYAGSSSGVTVNLSLGSATGFTSIAGIENVIGGSFDDTLTGDSGDNRLDGGANGVLGDTMAGGLGNDTYVVDSSLDTVTESANEGTDTVQSSLTDYTLGGQRREPDADRHRQHQRHRQRRRQHHHRQQRQQHARRRRRR